MGQLIEYAGLSTGIFIPRGMIEDSLGVIDRTLELEGFEQYDVYGMVSSNRI